MAYTVNAAFKEFRKEMVDLDSDEEDTARSSRDFLFEQIFKLPDEDSTFPWLTDRRIFFGSFARRTKIQPLDDIDIMVVMHGGGGFEVDHPWEPYRCKVAPGTMESPVKNLTDDEGFINSNRVLLKFRDSLNNIPHYEKAELHKRGEAVTLKLRSYPWNFDIVPTFGVKDEYNPLKYFVIPDGERHWKRTDPRRDDKRVTQINQKHNGLVLPTIRLIKYWNRKTQFPTMMSYWLETIALNLFEELESIQLLQLGIWQFFVKAPQYVRNRCPDSKNLGPDLDEDVDMETKLKIARRMMQAAEISLKALEYELKNDHKNAILCWQKIFGIEFPDYG